MTAMPTTERSVDAPSTTWGEAKITVAQANEFAKSVTPVRADQEAVARNLLLFPTTIKVILSSDGSNLSTGLARQVNRKMRSSLSLNRRRFARLQPKSVGRHRLRC